MATICQLAVFMRTPNKDSLESPALYVGKCELLYLVGYIDNPKSCYSFSGAVPASCALGSRIRGK